MQKKQKKTNVIVTKKKKNEFKKEAIKVCFENVLRKKS